MSDSFLRNALRQRLRAIAIADDRRSGSLSITFDRAFPGFDGHFAEQSIVPAVLHSTGCHPCRKIMTSRPARPKSSAEMLKPISQRIRQPCPYPPQRPLAKYNHNPGRLKSVALFTVKDA